MLAAMSPNQETVFQYILNERARQERLRQEGKFSFSCASRVKGPSFKLPILTKELGEVAKAINDDDRKQLITKLIQTAAVAVAWLESFDLISPETQD